AEPASGFRASQWSTIALLADWAEATGLWGRLVKRPLGTFLRPLGVLVIEEFGIARSGVTWKQAFLQSRIPAVVTGALLVALQASGTGVMLLIYLALAFALWATVSKFQQ